MAHAPERFELVFVLVTVERVFVDDVELLVVFFGDQKDVSTSGSSDTVKTMRFASD